MKTSRKSEQYYKILERKLSLTKFTATGYQKLLTIIIANKENTPHPLILLLKT